MGSIKSIWETFGDLLGATLIHPQFFAKRHAAKVRRLAIEQSKGIVADVGSGRAPYRKPIEAKSSVNKYLTIDHPEATELYDKDYPLDIKADIADHIPLGSKTVDTVVLLMVLEHVPQPSAAIAELFRILKPGGSLILSTVMTHPVHDPPFDFYRYTRFGLAKLLEENGFQIQILGWEGAAITTAVTAFNTTIFQQIKPLAATHWLAPIAVILALLIWPITIVLNLIAWVLAPLDRLRQLPHTVWAVAKRPTSDR